MYDMLMQNKKRKTNMKSPIEIKSMLERLVDQGIVTIDSQQLEDGRLTKLALMPSLKQSNTIKPEYICLTSNQDEPEINTVLKKLLLEGVSLGALRYLPDIHPDVVDFLTEADKASSMMLGREDVFNNMLNPESIVISVYRINYDNVEHEFDILAKQITRPDNKSTQNMIGIDGFSLAGYVAIHKDDRDPLEKAFSDTQNIDSAWTEGDNVLATSHNQGSSSVGDVFVFGNQAYCISGSGFNQIDDFSPAGVTAKKKGLDQSRDIFSM